MLISVNLSRAQQLLPLLEEELRVAERLSENLASWYRQVSADGFTDTAPIRQQMEYTHRLIDRLHARINLVQDAIDEFSTAKRVAGMNLDDAISILHASEGMLGP